MGDERENDKENAEEMIKKSNIEKTVREKKACRSKKVIWGIVGVVTAVILVCCGMLTGVMLERQEHKNQQTADVEDRDDAPTAATTTQYVVVNGSTVPVTVAVNSTADDGNGGGALAESVTLIPQDDKLALAFLKLHNERENSCYSPLSIRYALEMLRAGAKGETKSQIDSLLSDMVATRYANVADHLSMANALWVTEAYKGEVQENYRQILEQLGASTQVDNFQSAANINAWINDNTMGLMQNALSDGDVQGLNAALVNVLAIDMDWQQQFEKELTSGAYFDWHEGDTSEDYVTTMKITSGGNEGDRSIYYNLADEATVLAMDLKDYGEAKLQFVAIMPEDLQSYVQNVSVADINQLLTGLRVTRAQNDSYLFSFSAYIPKFEIKHGGLENLEKDLQDLGVTDVFDSSKSDLSAMLNVENFAIDTVTHKTQFDFSEEGIKAAAVTLMGGRGAGGDGPIPSSSNIVVSINGPFLYLVRDKQTGEIWFTGTVYKPNRWADDKVMYHY